MNSCQNRKRLPSIIVLLMVMAPFLFPVMSPAQDTDYRINPLDTLTMTIYAGGKEQQHVDLQISADGVIKGPLIGSVMAGGLTLSQLESLLTENLAQHYFVDPKVNLRVKDYHSFQYYISGSVKSSGLHKMTSRANLLELIAKAGGTLPGRGNVAYILRDSAAEIEEGQDVEDLLSTKEPVKVDLTRLLDKGDMTGNPVLQPGDVVYIPGQEALDSFEPKIYLFGEVKSTGAFNWWPGVTLLKFCIAHGGFTKFAAPNRTRVVRTNDKKEIITIKVDIEDIAEGDIPDFELKPDDVVYVPESWL